MKTNYNFYLNFTIKQRFNNVEINRLKCNQFTCHIYMASFFILKLILSYSHRTRYTLYFLPYKCFCPN